MPFLGLHSNIPLLVFSVNILHLQRAFLKALFNPPGLSIPTFLRSPVSFESLTVLKWIALLSMLADHLRHAIGISESGVLFAFGRLAFPLFVFVLASNLARARESGQADVMPRIVKRLLIYGAIAQPAYWVLMDQGIIPLNILFTLAACVLLIQLRPVFAILLFFYAGALVDYSWMGLLFFYSTYQLNRSLIRSENVLPTLFAWAIAFILVIVTVSHWIALFSIPLILGVWYWNLPIKLPRMKFMFYAIYPIHIWIFAAWSTMQA